MDVSGAGEMDRALERLGSALAAAGLPAFQPAAHGVAAALGELDEIIAPLFRLPAEVRRFWESVAPQSLPWVHPHPSGPEFASQDWCDTVGLDSQPPALFPVCYASHFWLYVELDDTQRRGGLFSGSPSSDAFELKFTSFTAWVELLAAAVEAGSYDVYVSANGARSSSVDSVWWDAAARAALSESPADSRYPRGLQIKTQVQYWPDHWLTPFEITQADLHACGASHVLADLTDVSPARPFDVTVTAEWRFVRNADPGRGIVQLTDRSGQLLFDLPADVETFGQGVRGMREFDITVYAAADPRASRPAADEASQPVVVGEITALRFLD